jgi:hypothetical protein
MIMLVPIPLLMPAMLVLIPPPVILIPASLSRRMQFATLVLRLLAVTPMMLNRLMKFVLGMHDAPLASILIFRMRARSRHHRQTHPQAQRQQRRICHTNRPMSIHIILQ